MRIVSLVFVGLLAWLHTTDSLARTLPRPMSLFRDGNHATAGYALFGLLAVVGVWLAGRLVIARRPVDAIVFVLATLAVVYVGATPSMDLGHGTCALVILVSFYLYYVYWLILAESRWLLVHLLVPFLLALISGCGAGFGVWQKGVILEVVVLMNLQGHHLSQLVTDELFGRRRATGRDRTDPWPRRKVVYILRGD